MSVLADLFPSQNVHWHENKCKNNNYFVPLSTPLFLSQGVPFPQNEANAMDVVIQFAVHKLGFQLSDIVVYAWSIGGFTGRDPTGICTLSGPSLLWEWVDQFHQHIVSTTSLFLPPSLHFLSISLFSLTLSLCTLLPSLSPSPLILPFLFLCLYISLCLSASWAVMSYPEIQALVLDASFDDLLPLALKVMPDSWSESRAGVIGQGVEKTNDVI